MIGISTVLHSADHIYKPKGDLRHLFWSSVARRIAVSFLSFYSAIYVYQLYLSEGYDNKGAIYFVLLFFLLLLASKQITFSVSENLSQKIGFGGTIKLSLLPFLLLILSMIFSQSQPALVFLGGVLWGVHAGLFWWGYHGYFVKVGDSKHFGAGLGEVEMLRAIATVVAPITGALIIDVFGYNSIFVLSAIFMSLSVMLLHKSKNFRQKHDVSYSEVIELLFKHKSVSLAYAAVGAEAIFYTVLWALFLYIFFGDVLGFGFIVSVSLLISALFGLVVGKKLDKKGENKMIKFGSPGFSLSWMLRVVGGTPISYIFADSFRHFSDKLVSMPLIELSYKKGVEDYVAKAILFMEIAVGVGALSAIALIFIFTYLEFDFTKSFFAISLISLLPLVAIMKKRI